MDPAIIPVLKQTMRQGVAKEEISRQPSTRARLVAAVAYILRHRNEYLDDDNRLRMSYSQLLVDLTGCTPYEVSAAITISRRLGLHIAEKSPKGNPHLKGTYWTVTIVSPEKRKTAQQAEVVATVRRAYDGDISKKQIRLLETTTEQVAAAVGYILRHGNTFLDHLGRVTRPYPVLLGELTGRPEEDHEKLRKSSGNHRLHRMAPAAPRGMALPGVRKPVILTPLEELERQVKEIPMLAEVRPAVATVSHGLPGGRASSSSP